MEVKYNSTNINLKINSNNIIGYNSNIDIKSLIKKGKLFIDSKEINENNIYDFKKRISIVKKEYTPLVFKSNIYEIMYYEIRKNSLSLKSPAKKIKDSLKIVGLKTSYLERNIHTLSSSEKKLLSISIALLSNPDIIILIDPFLGLDMKKRKKLQLLFNRMKEDYNKTIIIISDDLNILFKCTDYIVLKGNNYIINGKTKDIFEDVSFFIKHHIPIPEIINLTYKAKKKNIKLDYHRDIRDIIKDIYKHV